MAKRCNLLSINTVRPILLLYLNCVSSVECSQNVKRDNELFENFDEIRYFRRTSRNPHVRQKRGWGECLPKCGSDVLSNRLLPWKVEIEESNYSFYVVLRACSRIECWGSLTGETFKEGWRKQHNKELRGTYSSTYRALVGTREGKKIT
jgi:hypothetical protein